VTPPIIIFAYDDRNKAQLGRVYQLEAALAGFRVIVTSWQNIELSADGAVIRDGRQIEANTAEESGILGQHVMPEVLFHRNLIRDRSEEVLERLVESTGCLCSYHPAWKPIGQKWILENCFLNADSKGLTVPRPPTYLVPRDSIQDALSSTGRRKPLIFKPSDASLCEGILLSSPSDFAVVAQMVRRARWAQYVVQEIEPDSLLYHGRRFDLRVYALVTSFRPLRFMVPREGVTRIAAKPYDRSMPSDSLSVLTGSSYRLRQLGWADNLSISDLLAYLTRQNLDISDFWTMVESLLQSVFMALAEYAPLASASNLEGRFYLAGLDLLMVKQGDSYSLRFLETNYVPDLVGWGSSVDQQLRSGHQRWLSHLSAYATARSC
jgi:hypothetical protein